MDYKIKGCKPEKLFNFFEEISAVPRGSKNNQGISDYLVKFAEDRNLDFYRDDLLNVIIRKPGSKGALDKDPVILQGHMDMVCEKIEGCDHDFEKEGIDIVVEDGFVHANGTTLGADDGTAVALMLTILDDDNAVHPPLECLFTTDEEIGLLGAAGLDCSQLKGHTMINLDSEEEGVITVSCAGGMRYTMERKYQSTELTGTEVKLSVSGLLGGHSGSDVDKERTNGIKLMARILDTVSDNKNAHLVHFTGGSKDNAIPRECKAAVLFNTAADAAEAVKKWELLKKDLENEILPFEKSFQFSIDSEDNVTCKVMNREDSDALLGAVLLVPNGVRKRNPSKDFFVITSLNLGVIRTENGVAELVFSPRSSIESLQEETISLLNRTASLFGFETAIDGRYPGWEYKENSKVREVFIESYSQLFNDDLKVEAIHAGLECGLFSAQIPNLDAVAVGPTLTGVHTPDEKMELASFERFYSLLEDVLKRLAQ